MYIEMTNFIVTVVHQQFTLLFAWAQTCKPKHILQTLYTFWNKHALPAIWIIDQVFKPAVLVCIIKRFYKSMEVFLCFGGLQCHKKGVSLC